MHHGDENQMKMKKSQVEMSNKYKELEIFIFSDNLLRASHWDCEIFKVTIETKEKR